LYTFSTACLVVTILAVAGSAASRQGSAKSVREGAYTMAQAQRGKAAFDKQCLGCHADPKFGYSVIDDRAGLPVADLFEFVKTSMPEDNPGSLQPGQYADILAYFFSLRGLPAGDGELVSDVAALKHIQIEKP
jgi:mono/diheme cytochrome c family protein